nr:alpha/beta hydrolase [uncultured Pedobacter sp.]
MKSTFLTLVLITWVLVAGAQNQKSAKRPQTPKAPYPYYTEEVKFTNAKDSITLAGTLSLPADSGIYPVVILISGSGPQNRDEELFDHKPFLVISDYLTRKGIGVLRYDDRGTAHSTGNFRTSTSVSFADDAAAAVAYLKSRKEVDPRQIGLAGHSEGGMIAPMVAAGNKDVAFIILMAAPGIPIVKLLDLQSERLGILSGGTKEMVDKNVKLEHGMYEIIMKNHTNSLNIRLTAYLTKAMASLPPEIRPAADVMDQEIKTLIRRSTTPWFKYFLQYEPARNLSLVRCPVLVLNGSLDAQVTSKENLHGIKQALDKGRNRNYKIIEYPGVNHLFQEAKTGAFEEYQLIEQTMSPKVLDDIATWINSIIRR